MVFGRYFRGITQSRALKAGVDRYLTFIALQQAEQRPEGLTADARAEVPTDLETRMGYLVPDG
jgi:hypothetical protein